MRGLSFLALLVAFTFFSTGASAGDDADGGSISGCVERIPAGGQKPILHETFPDRGTSGYVATLVVTVEHGKGESVLPQGLELQSAGDAATMLREAGFVIPHQDGGAGARLIAGPPDPTRPDRATTILELPLLPLPKEPGRRTLFLPAVPIAVARASGDIASTCTRPHRIVVEDPIASTPDAKPMPNPPPRAQREEWTALKRGLMWGLPSVLLGALLAYLMGRWLRRPRPVPPPPPPRPSWEVALEKLDEIRHAGLLDVGRHAEYFDRVNDTLRSYLGGRFGFDGLESTTDEILSVLGNVWAAPLGEGALGVAFPDVVAFLGECDLVKFANVTPTPGECSRALDMGERIVRATMPNPLSAPRGEAP